MSVIHAIERPTKVKEFDFKLHSSKLSKKKSFFTHITIKNARSITFPFPSSLLALLLKYGFAYDTCTNETINTLHISHMFNAQQDVRTSLL